MPASRAAQWGLWALVLLQLAIPASYYLRGGSQDDERFAWRMFSDVRFRKCEVTAFERDGAGERPLRLEHALHASWAGLLRRGRPAVIEGFLRARCHESSLVSATLRRSCREVVDDASFRQSYQLQCDTGHLSLQEQRP